MALKKFKCLECEKEFTAGQWICASGDGHKVATKRYYMSDAPTVVTTVDGKQVVNKRDSGTLVMNIPPERRTTGPDGNERVLPGGTAQFIRGLYETSDPEKQFWLDQKKGLCTESEWQNAYLNDQEKMDLERMEMAAERSRLVAERNSLLEQVQKRA